MPSVALPLRPGARLLAAFHLPGRLALLGGVLLLQPLAWQLDAGALGLGSCTLLAYLLLCWHALLRAGLRSLAATLEALRSGDLTRSVPVAGRDELAALQREADRVMRGYSAIVATVRSEAQLVAMSGEQLTREAAAMSDRTSQQASSLEETSASVAELAATVQRNAQAVQAADTLAGRVRGSAEDGLKVVTSAVESMQGLEQRARQMTEIIGVIDGIAFQTNILALNAAVEAARAGEHGRGFAVVAGEVRTLAQRSAQAAAEVRKLIDGSSADIHGGVQRIRASTQAFDSVVHGIREVAQTLQAVSSSSAQQSAGLQEIATAVRGIDELTQRHAHNVDVTVQAADRLREQSQQISASVITIKLRQGCADEARALVEKAVACIRQQGREAAIAAIHDPKGPFRDRDMFVFVLDGNNHFRAFGADPAKANKPAVAAPGVDIKELCSRTHAAAKAGGGWVAFSSMHPTTGVVVDKLGYVLPAVDDWVVMCSINRSDGSGEAPVRRPASPAAVTGVPHLAAA